MQVKEIIVECKKSKNFQTYGVSQIISLDKEDNIEEVTKQAQAWCRKKVMEEHKHDAN